MRGPVAHRACPWGPWLVAASRPRALWIRAYKGSTPGGGLTVGTVFAVAVDMAPDGLAAMVDQFCREQAEFRARLVGLGVATLALGTADRPPWGAPEAFPANPALMLSRAFGRFYGGL